MAHFNERLEGVAPYSPFAVYVRKAGHAKVVAALLAMLYGHL